MEEHVTPQPVVATHNHTLPPSLQQPQQVSSVASTSSGTLPSAEPERLPEGIEAMTTQEALRKYAPKQKIRDKIVADYKKGLDAAHLAAKHDVALCTVLVVIKRYRELESMALSTSIRWRRKKKADAEEAERKLNESGQPEEKPTGCTESDWARMKDQGACVACTVKFQKIALGRSEKSGANVKRSRTHHGCRIVRFTFVGRGIAGRYSTSMRNPEGVQYS